MINKSYLNTSTPCQLENEAVAEPLLAYETKEVCVCVCTFVLDIPYTLLNEFCIMFVHVYLYMHKHALNHNPKPFSTMFT